MARNKPSRRPWDSPEAALPREATCLTVCLGDSRISILTFSQTALFGMNETLLAPTESMPSVKEALSYMLLRLLTP